MKKTKKPYFSIVTVVKNDVHNIDKTIKSVISQNYKNFEYIIIDGRSIDGTIIKINKYKAQLKHFLTEKDRGIYFAMNKGIKIAKGQIIVFVNSGDLLTKNALAIIFKKFNKHKNIDFVFGTVKRHYTTQTIIKSGYNPFRIKYNFDFATSHSTGFYIKLQSLKKVGIFNTIYHCSADYDLYYRAILNHKMIGNFTTRNQLVGIVKSGGYSSKLSFMDHLFEETRIRFDNNQNVFIIILIFINTLIKRLFK